MQSENVWFVLLLFYATATVFPLYLCGDMMYEMRRKPVPILLLIQWIFNPQQGWHIYWKHENERFWGNIKSLLVLPLPLQLVVGIRFV